MLLNALAHNELGLSALREAGNIGAGNGLTALAAMTSGRVDMAIPTVEILPLKKFSEIIVPADANTVGVILRVSGAAPGHIVLLWPERTAQRLADLLLGRAPGGKTAFDEMECSALMEAGNIFGSTFLVALSCLTGLYLALSPPAIAIDGAAAILCTVGAEVALCSDETFIIATRIGVVEGEADGCFLLIPEIASLSLILRALNVEC